MKTHKRLYRDCRAASAAEYALLLGLLGVSIGLAALALGASISDSVDRASTEMETCGGGC